jgi:hypothetical protein
MQVCAAEVEMGWIGELVGDLPAREQRRSRLVAHASCPGSQVVAQGEILARGLPWGSISRASGGPLVLSVVSRVLFFFFFVLLLSPTSRSLSSRQSATYILQLASSIVAPSTNDLA